MFYCMFYFTCDRSLIQLELSPRRRRRRRRRRVKCGVELYNDIPMTNPAVSQGNERDAPEEPCVMEEEQSTAAAGTPPGR